MDPRKTHAIAFIDTIRKMDPKDLNDLITRVAGEDFAQFCLDYSSQLIANDPERVLENTSSLMMLMGYLIAKAERNNQTPWGLLSTEVSA